MRTNLERAENGRDIAALALNGKTYIALEDYEPGVVDALANLMHCARRYGFDFDACLLSAREHHEYETTFKWDETPDA